MKKKEEKAKSECDDKNCAIHGSLKVRGRSFTGIVTSDKMSKTAIVEWTIRRFIPKYERYEIRIKKKKAHNPMCISAVNGDKVRIIECRPLSKTKNFVIVERL